MTIQKQTQYTRTLRPKRLIHWALVSILMLTVTSCEDFFVSEVTNLNTPGSEPQLVVYSFISPADTMVWVYVDRSRPYVNTGRPYAPVGANAEVFMARKGEEFVKLHYRSDMQRYVISAKDFPIIAGQYYQLKVETTLGEKASAECWVPEFEIARIELDPPFVATDSWGSNMLRLNWRITTANNGKTNYYRTGAIMQRWEVVNWGNQPDTFFLGQYPVEIDRGQEFFSDPSSRQYAFRASTYYSSYESDWKHNFREESESSYKQFDSLSVFVIQSDIHYFNFHQSARDYYYYDEDFPLAESVHIYTNIKNGLGVFGGYSMRSYVVPAQRK